MVISWNSEYCGGQKYKWIQKPTGWFNGKNSTRAIKVQLLAYDALRYMFSQAARLSFSEYFSL